MPSALETLVKILKLEREQGCNDTAVIGGLAAFSRKWTKDAHQQARKPEHHRLVDELEKLLQDYAAVESRTERHTTIQYMMDRITGRVAAPPEYQVTESPPEPPPTPPPSPPPAPAPRKPAAPRQPSPPRRERGGPAQQQQQQPKRREKQPSVFQQALQLEVHDEFEHARYTGQMDIQPPPSLARPPRSPRPALPPDEAADILRGLRAPVSVVKGVGERME